MRTAIAFVAALSLAVLSGGLTSGAPSKADKKFPPSPKDKNKTPGAKTPPKKGKDRHLDGHSLLQHKVHKAPNGHHPLKHKSSKHTVHAKIHKGKVQGLSVKDKKGKNVQVVRKVKRLRPHGGKKVEGPGGEERFFVSTAADGATFVSEQDTPADGDWQDAEPVQFGGGGPGRLMICFGFRGDGGFMIWFCFDMGHVDDGGDGPDGDPEDGDLHPDE